MLFANGTDVNNQSDSRESLLEVSIESNHTDVVALLIERGEKLTSWSSKPLHEAIRLGQHDLVGFVLDDAVDINCTCKWYYCPPLGSAKCQICDMSVFT